MKLFLEVLFVCWMGLPVCGQEVREENFEQGVPVGWLGREDWITEEGGLRHAPAAEEGISYLFYPMDSLDLEYKSMEWEISVKNEALQIGRGEKNYFDFYFLAAGTPDSLRHALYLSLGPDSSDLRLVQNIQGKETVQSSAIAWNRAEVHELWITYDREEGLLIYQKRKGRYLPLAVFSAYRLPAEMCRGKLYGGMSFRYSPKGRGKLWLGDWKMITVYREAAYLGQKIIPDTGICLTYSVPLMQEGATEIQNYRLRRNGVAYPIDSVRMRGKDAVLIYTALLSGEYELEVREMEAVSGQKITVPVKTFSYISRVEPGDIVINEIMFAPSDSLGLPKEEYLELYNLRDYPLRLDSVSYSDRGILRDYLCDTIAASGYLLLCRSGAVEALSGYGQVSKVKNFLLVDTAAEQVLKTRRGILLDSVYYRKEWIRNAKKRRGGHALERIFPGQKSEAEVFNWYECQAEQGGTPGSCNSVYASPPDRMPPKALSCIAGLPGWIRLEFSEVLYLPDAVTPVHYNLGKGFGFPDSVRVAGQEIQLYYHGLKTNRSYQLEVDGIRDLSGNKLQDTVLHLFLFAFPEWGDILLNEVLYDAVPADAEYVELYNNSEKRILLRDLCLAKQNENLEWSVVRKLEDSCGVLEPDSLIWICSNPEEICSRYVYHEVQNCFVIQSMLQLNNSQGNLAVIRRRDSVVLDQLEYDKTLHDYRLSRTKGIALERVSETDRWTSAGGNEEEGRGSPGLPNRAQLTPGDTVNPGDEDTWKKLVELEPEVFTPDADGYEDVLTVCVGQSGDKFTLKLFIYTATGREVRELANGMPVQGRQCFTWDGTNGRGQLMPAGIYVVYVYCVFQQGNTREMRKVCVLSR